MKKYSFLFFLIILIAVVALGCNTVENDPPELLSTATPEITATPLPRVTPSPTPSPSPTPVPTPQYVDFVLGGAGDIMVHNYQLIDAKTTAKEQELSIEYTFNHWFTDIKDALIYPDIMVANFETVLAGEKRNFTGYPSFNSPDEILAALKDAGFDVLTNANNHTLDRGSSGLLRTIEKFDEYGFYHAGTFASQKSADTPVIVEIEEVKIAYVSACYGVSGYGGLTKEQKLYMVDVLDIEKTTQKVRDAKAAGADVVVMSVHWGYEFSRNVSASQKEFADAFIAAGADVIFGHHPHVLQTVDYVKVQGEDGKEREAIVYWSLGNLVSNQPWEYTNAGAIAYVDIRYDRENKRISIMDSSYVPTYVFRDTGWGNRYHILPVGYALDNPDNLSIELGKYTVNYMEKVWKQTVKLLGEDDATPLRELNIID